MSEKIEIRVYPNDSQDIEELKAEAIQHSGLQNGSAILLRRSLDARSRNPFYIYRFEVFSSSEIVKTDLGFKLKNATNFPEIHIVGFGPAGIFAALQCIELGFKPVIFERGKNVKERRRDLAELNRSHQVNPESNYCYGEGGAGTYSDGKLYTRSDKRGPVQKVLQTFVEYGAAENIIWEAHPHIGTNKLPAIIENMRNAIIQCGGEIHFEKKVTGLTKDGEKIQHLIVNDSEKIKVNEVVLATGHSARDIFKLFHRENILIEAKPFAIGVRMEHPQELIDKIQYKCERTDSFLPPSSYALVEQIQGRGVFSFCMCPGGIIAPAATAAGEIVVNGWSPSKRNGKFANSGFVVAVDDKDFVKFDKYGPLKAMKYQSFWEQKAFETNKDLTAPAQRIEDFIQNKFSNNLPECSYIPGIKSREIDEVLSFEVGERIRQALVVLGKKLHGFRTNEAILVGVESRSSSPVKIPRDKVTLSHTQLSNLYPCAEGSGYAGGIMSAALDGIKVVTAIHDKVKK